MSDIVERLRKGIEWTGPTQDDTGQTEHHMDEAADEIERLRAALSQLARYSTDEDEMDWADTVLEMNAIARAALATQPVEEDRT